MSRQLAPKSCDATPVGPDTVFQIALLSKSLAASVSARQVGAGILASTIWTSMAAIGSFAVEDLKGSIAQA